MGSAEFGFWSVSYDLPLRNPASNAGALAYIFRTPVMTQTDLAKCLELECASVGHVIDQLEKAVYVECSAVEGNRRI